MERGEMNLDPVSFEDDLTFVQDEGIYRPEVIDAVTCNSDLLRENHIRWDDALAETASYFGVESLEKRHWPESFEQESYRIVGEREQRRPTKTLLGFAGAGGAGKGAVSEHLGLSRVINTTTREQRSYETDGVHYHFVSPDEFTQLENAGEFILTADRPGRGLYGTNKSDIERAFSGSDAAVIEESPENLARLGKQFPILFPDNQFYLIYVMPPFPVFHHLALRLANRCFDSGEDFVHAIPSTLGSSEDDFRQVREFLSLLRLMNEGTEVLYTVNDEIDRAAEKIEGIYRPE